MPGATPSPTRPSRHVTGPVAPRRSTFLPVLLVAPCPLRVVLFVQPHSVTGSRCPA